MDSPSPASPTPTRRRRGRGEGSITRLADGRWQGRVDLGWHGGKRVRKAVYGRTKAEVQQKLRQLLAARDQGRPLPSDDRLTLGAFLTRWLEDVAARKVRPTTLRRYSLDVARITAALGRVRLSRLSSADVQRFLNGLSDQGLSSASVRHCRATLRAALNQAVSWDLIATNPAAGPRVAVPVAPQTAVPALTPALARQVLQAVAGSDVEGPVTLALYLGLRQAEVLGLCWSDVRLDAGPPTLTVRHQLQRLGGAWRLTPPKSESSRRTLPLPPPVVQALVAERRRQAAARLAAGPAWQPPIPDLVFTTATGQPRHGCVITHAFQRRLRQAGLPHLRFHDLRHAAASLLAAGGVPLKAVSDLLGHSQIATTANIYSHISDAVRREVVDRLAALLGPDPAASSSSS
jgi:integrase